MTMHFKSKLISISKTLSVSLKNVTNVIFYKLYKRQFCLKWKLNIAIEIQDTFNPFACGYNLIITDNNKI